MSYDEFTETKWYPLSICVFWGAAALVFTAAAFRDAVESNLEAFLCAVGIICSAAISVAAGRSYWQKRKS